MMEDISQPQVNEPTSEARIAANRLNAQESTGPKSEEGKAHSSANSRRHGLTARNQSPGQDNERAAEFFHFCRSQFNPKNTLEAVEFVSLLGTRLWDDRYIEIERGVLLSRPLSQALNDNLFTILNEPKSVAMLSQLGRHFLHNSRAFEKALLSLIRIRHENWKSFDVRPAPYVVSNGAQKSAEMPAGGKTDVPPVNCGTLADLLADGRLIFPGEEGADFALLATGLWDAFQPANLLEGFVACDFIIAEWRLERLNHMRKIIFARRSTSDSEVNCGDSFAFVNDYHTTHALEPLLEYERALQKHREKRMTLFRKLRSDYKQDVALPAPAPATAQPVVNSDTPSSSATESSPPEQFVQPETEAKPKSPSTVSGEPLLPAVTTTPTALKT